MVSKRTFSSNTFILIVGSSLPAYMAVAAAFAIGFSSYLFAMWFSPFGDLANIPDVADFGYDYLLHMVITSDNINLNLNTYDIATLQELLRYQEAYVHLHELLFDRSVSFINSLEQNGDPLFDEYDELFETWRFVGNYMLETYRNLEGILNISLANSRIEPTWYE